MYMILFNSLCSLLQTYLISYPDVLFSNQDCVYLWFISRRHKWLLRPLKGRFLSSQWQICPISSFVLFCVAIKYFNFLNLFLPRKSQEFAENLPFFICLFPLCWNSSSKNSFVTWPQVGEFWCHSLKIIFFLNLWALLEVQTWWLGKYYPKRHCSMAIAVLSIFGAKLKIALTGVRSRVRESLTKRLI